MNVYKHPSFVYTKFSKLAKEITYPGHVVEEGRASEVGEDIGHFRIESINLIETQNVMGRLCRGTSATDDRGCWSLPLAFYAAASACAVDSASGGARCTVSG